VAWTVQAGAGLLWGLIVVTVVHSIAERTKRSIDWASLKALPDDSCGPIIWTGLDDTVSRAPDLR
jgi:hypothetical protein